MFCPYCGKGLNTDGEFCPYCGKRIDGEKKEKYSYGEEHSEQDIHADEVQWFYVIGSDKFGPVNISQIRTLIKEGNITRETYVWNHSMKDWIEAGQIKELAGDLGIVTPAIPISAVSSAYAWALATIPLLVSYNAYWFTTNELIINLVVIGLNILFFALDCRELNKGGKDPGNWIWTGLFLVPVYLFIRGSKMGKQYGYGITWCILFVLTSFILV